MKYLKKKPNAKEPRAGYALPFFLVLAALTVVSFIIPLRPTQSQSEKRNLAEFPEFSVHALISGSYFDDINTWFSDTFPGRESWLELNNTIFSLHGRADVSIQGDIQIADPIPEIPVATRPPETEAPADTTPVTQVPTEPPTQPSTEEMAPPTNPVEEWGGVDAGEDGEVYLSTSIQVGDSAFTYFGFGESFSNRYIKVLNKFAQSVEELGVRVVQASPPTAVGVMVENEYMEKLNCSPQDQVIDYINGSLSESIFGIDTYESLIDHNDEYIYFRTDHHWSALGAYYVYRDVCEALDMTPAELDSFEIWDQGEFQGSLYYNCRYTNKLRLDNVIAYNPPGELTTRIYDEYGGNFKWDVLTDMSKSGINSKYMTFLAGDHPLVTIVNDSIPDAPNCVLVKDSFGNCFAPFLTQNYHTVYVLDYRNYWLMGLKAFVVQNNVQDVIFMPNLAAVQSDGVCNLLESLTR